MTLNELFKNTTYDDTLFSAEAKSAIESRIFMKSVRGSEVPSRFSSVIKRLAVAKKSSYTHGTRVSMYC